MGLGRKKGPGGGGGVGAVLTVTAPAGMTVSVSKDGKVKTKISNAEGLAVFKGLETGTWTLTITDGVQTSTKTVSVTADYSTVLAFFSATINITYPAGSTCTCSDGSTTFTAPDTSGTWACVVPNAGTWTVSCTDGTESKSENVSITANGQSIAIELAFLAGVLYKKGNECTEITGGWTSKKNCLGNITKKADRISLNLNGSSSDTYFVSHTENKIDLSDYKQISFVFDSFSRSDTEDLSVRVYVGLFKNIPTVIDYETIMSEGVATTRVTTKGTACVDLSGLMDTYYVAVCGLFWNSSSYTLNADIVEVFAE